MHPPLPQGVCPDIGDVANKTTQPGEARADISATSHPRTRGAPLQRFCNVIKGMSLGKIGSVTLIFSHLNVLVTYKNIGKSSNNAGFIFYLKIHLIYDDNTPRVASETGR
ncbi:hypothetical protein AVEN_192290-1 [Araneus ventricosus]|uniref:Uncharacterized protein n=1 Tax=Araneus ventricosus TaxID=182803 RepID=A0A4Y2G7V3_ARAVE|nr:hypothetical protein AVEN_192290-1 [Araneus ventricosus]